MTNYLFGSDAGAFDLADAQAMQRLLFDSLGYAGTTARADGYIRISQSGANALVEIDADGAANGAHFTTVITLVDRTAGTISDGFVLF